MSAYSTVLLALVGANGMRNAASSSTEAVEVLGNIAEPKCGCLCSMDEHYICRVSVHPSHYLRMPINCSKRPSRAAYLLVAARNVGTVA